jgi:hypothetical protein
MSLHLQIIMLAWRIISIKGRAEQQKSAAGVRTMKNITVSVPDEVYLDARVWAARRGISVFAAVKLFLGHLSDDSEFIAAFLNDSTPYPLYP